LAAIQAQLSTKLEYKEAILGAILAIATTGVISFFSGRATVSASKVVGGQYAVQLYEYDQKGQPKRDKDGKLVGRSQAIIPIDFGGAFTKPPRVIVSINGIDAYGNAMSESTHTPATMQPRTGPISLSGLGEIRSCLMSKYLGSPSKTST